MHGETKILCSFRCHKQGRPFKPQARSGLDERLQLPAYKLGGKPFVYFAAWKQHYSLYPATRRVYEALGNELAPYKVQKATIRFKFTDAVPDKLISRVAKFRAKEVRERLQE